MKVRELLSIKGVECFSITPNNTLLEAAKQMSECKIGALLVMDKGALVGIVTERDIVKNAANEAKPCKDVTAKEAMTTNLLISRPEDSLEYVMAVMTQNNIRHLPVVDERGLVGMLSMRDVVKTMVKNLKAENQYLKDLIGDKLGEVGD
ncbi:MAG TPA: histidine kinase [Nitrospiraceae bacterium]|nr:histidine kinase [Nitrospiraceae bacterium]